MINTLRLYYEKNQVLKLTAIGGWKSSCGNLLATGISCCSRHKPALKSLPWAPLASQKTHHRWIHFCKKISKKWALSNMLCLKPQNDHLHPLPHQQLFIPQYITFGSTLKSHRIAGGKSKLIRTPFVSGLDLPETFCSISDTSLSMSFRHVWSAISDLLISSRCPCHSTCLLSSQTVGTLPYCTHRS